MLASKTAHTLGCSERTGQPGEVRDMGHRRTGAIPIAGAYVLQASRAQFALCVSEGLADMIS